MKTMMSAKWRVSADNGRSCIDPQLTIASDGSADGSSDADNDNDNNVDDGDPDVDDAYQDVEPDVDADQDAELEPEPEPEPDADSPTNSSTVSSSQRPTVLEAVPPPAVTRAELPGTGTDTTATTLEPPAPAAAPETTAVDLSLLIRPPPRKEALTARTYDIVPTTAAPHSTSINAVTATGDMRWVFSGGSDGYVRKFNWVESINSKLMLTVAQRHPFVDSVVKAGVLMNYWENMDGNTLSPVYSLAAHSQGLWLLTGLESGNIRLQTIRHEEGREIASLYKHTSSVSVLTLAPDEKSLISGSWDKKMFDWDLNTGETTRHFGPVAGQISSIQFRPESTLPVPYESEDPLMTNGTYSSNYNMNRTDSFAFQNGEEFNPDVAPGSPRDSLFNDSLFGDGDGDGDGDGEHEGSGQDNNQGNSSGLFGVDSAKPLSNGTNDAMAAGLPNGIPPEPTTGTNVPSEIETERNNNFRSNSFVTDLDPFTTADTQASFNFNPDINADSTPASATTFLSSSIDGALRIWDRRQPQPAARLHAARAFTPPWCMSACWSPDGEYVYAGRRNGTVEEYSLRTGLGGPARTFRFPSGSGPVTAVRAMPNGRHLVWLVLILPYLPFSLFPFTLSIPLPSLSFLPILSTISTS